MNNEINVEDLIKRIQEEEEFVKSQTLNYEEYLPEFISKAQEDIEIIEDGAIELEKDNENYDIINSMFRSFHNIKGSSGFVGQDVIQKVAHQTETMLDECRKGRLKADKYIVDLILKSSDFIKSICDSPELNDEESFLNIVYEHISDLEKVDPSDSAPKEIPQKEAVEIIDNTIFEKFASEIKKYIENIRNEKNSDNIFKHFHTIKGFAGFSEQKIIQRIAHESESLIDHYIKNDIEIKQEIIELLLESTNIINKICDDISLIKDQEFLENICSHLQELTVEKEVQTEQEVDSEFLQDFLVEATEHIENIEMNVIVLEKDPKDSEIINSIFRSFHTIKGLAGFVEQTLIEKIAHKTETLLDGCRKKTVKINKHVTDLILISSDFIRKICEDISAAKDREVLTQINEHLEKLESPSKEDFFEEDIPAEPPKIGEILVAEKKIKEEDVQEIVEKQKTEYPDLKFGQVAVKEKKTEVKDVISAFRTQQSKSSVEEYMRISTGKVDNLVEMVGELVITQSLVEQHAAAQCDTDNVFYTNFSRMTRITKDLQNLAMYLRMVPLKSTFQKITRIARDTINDLGKEIDFSTSGDETEIDRIVTEKLLDPLVHLVKNAISHGIEKKGSVKVNAYNKRGNIYIEVIDDGNGINVDKVYKKAVEKGLVDNSREYSEKEIQEFIMLPGFSTVEVANNVSGRGVGMDVVKTEIQKIGGKVEIKSEQGEGTTFTLKIPVNHAIMNGLVIDIEGTRYILPTVNVKQIVQPTEEHWVFTHGVCTHIKVRGDVIPVIHIKTLFGQSQKEAPKLVVIIEMDQKYVALPVKNVLHRQEVVIKPVGEEFAGLDFVSGMSILGDGKVSLILDVESMFNKGAAK